MDLTDPGIRAARHRPPRRAVRRPPGAARPGGRSRRHAVRRVAARARLPHAGRLDLPRGRGGARPGDCRVVEVTPPATASVTEELRLLDRLARHLPPDAVAAIEAFDPERRGRWLSNAFVTTDEPILGRPVSGGRPAAFLALEDKLLAEEVWVAAGRAHGAAPRGRGRHGRGGPGRPRARRGRARGAGPTRGGLVGRRPRRLQRRRQLRALGRRRAASAAAALAFFAPRCDRVRVLPFLEGVPCSIHGFVLPDGTAALRPVEIAMLRDRGRAPLRLQRPRHVLGPAARPTARRCATVVRRVGAHLQAAHGYRGGFGIDGVLTADGFRPTELNSRMSAGADAPSPRWTGSSSPCSSTTSWRARHRAAGRRRRGAGAADGRRAQRPRWSPSPRGPARAHRLLPRRLGRPRLHARGHRAPAARSRSPTPRAGCCARIDPCTVLPAGRRLAEVTVALLAFLDREYGTHFGAARRRPRRALSPAPAPGRRVLAMARVVVLGGGFGGLASAVRLAKLGPRRHARRAVRRPRRRALLRRRGRLHLGRRPAAGPACRRCCATCSASPGARWSARSSWSRSTCCASTASRTTRRCRCAPAGPRSWRRSTPSRPAWAGAGSTTSRRTPTTGRCCAAATSRCRGSATRLPRELAARLDSREVLHRRLRRTFRDERARLVAGHPFVADGHDLRNVPAWLGVTAYVDQRFGAWTVPGGMAAVGEALARRLVTRKVTVLASTSARDLVLRAGRVAAVATSAGELDGRRRGLRGRPARPAGAGAVRGAHDAGDPAGGHPPRAARGGARPARTSWCCTATRCWSCAPAAGRPRAATPGPCTGAAGSPRTCWSRWPGTASTCATRSSPGSTARRATSSRPGAARRWACCGRGGPRCGAGSGRTPRSRGCTPPGRTRRPGSGLPFVGLSAALVAQAIGPA